MWRVDGVRRARSQIKAGWGWASGPCERWLQRSNQRYSAVWCPGGVLQGAVPALFNVFDSELVGWGHRWLYLP